MKSHYTSSAFLYYHQIMFMLGFIFLLWPLPSFAQDTASAFLEGVAAYEAKEFEKAESLLRPLFEQQPNNPALLYNLGLVEYQLGHFGLALGLWRKARFIDSGLREAQQAIRFTEEQLFPDQEEPPVYALVFNALTSLPLFVWILISLSTLLFSGWVSIDYGVKRRLPFHQWPNSLAAMIPIFILSSFFVTYLTLDQFVLEATVIEKDRLTHVSPSPDAPTLSELEEGQVVRVEKKLGQWIRIRTQRGALGWVPEKAVIMFKGF